MAEAIAARGSFSIALSGGSMPKTIAGLAQATPAVDWSKWHVFYSDERHVPIDHADSNHAACAAMLALRGLGSMSRVPGAVGALLARLRRPTCASQRATISSVVLRAWDTTSTFSHREPGMRVAPV